MNEAIRVENLVRHYKRSSKKKKTTGESGPLIALDGVSLEVRPGELFGLLGPNGAGKTTLIKILTTLLAPTSGEAWVDGLNILTQPRELRPRINMVSGGESCGYGVLSVRENLWLFSQIYGVTNAVAKTRIDTMLDIVGLTEKAGTRVSHLSTGQRQKMNFCRGFITDPKILFLDEPTLGLDVNAARAIRKFVKEWLAEREGRTLLLTTHYMQEADDLCDRLAVIDRGKVLAYDTPENLRRRVQKYPIFELSWTPGPGDNLDPATIPGVRQAIVRNGDAAIDWKLIVEEEGVIGTVIASLMATQARIVSLKKTEATLEEVFLQLVGRGLDAPEDPAEGATV